ncbi:MAG: hypothetical protein IPI35_31070 [Deltaproteobacteria bacterium]|nr:hypothetical protein [Deltaproteobacteria bacterium]
MRGGGEGVRADAATVTAMRLAEARAALDDGDPQTAIVEAEELLDVDPENLDALFLVGDASRARRRLGRPRRVRALLRALPRGPRRPLRPRRGLL